MDKIKTYVDDLIEKYSLLEFTGIVKELELIKRLIEDKERVDACNRAVELTKRLVGERDHPISTGGTHTEIYLKQEDTVNDMGIKIPVLFKDNKSVEDVFYPSSDAPDGDIDLSEHYVEKLIPPNIISNELDDSGVKRISYYANIGVGDILNEGVIEHLFTKDSGGLWAIICRRTNYYLIQLK